MDLGISRRTMLRVTTFAAARRAFGQRNPPERLFRFRRSFWLNLHHFLYVLGRARNNQPDSRRSAVAGAPNDGQAILALPEPDRTAWDKTIAAYANSVSKRDLIFDRRLSLLTKTISGVNDDARVLPPEVDAEVRDALAASAPIYRRVWWDRHSTANRERILELQPLIGRYGSAIAGEVSSAYRTQWPEAGFHVDVVAYAQWAGAYSTGAGLIVISSLDRAQAGAQGLESVFHEAMHQWDDATEQAIREIAKKSGRTVPNSLSHSLIFYTAGYVVAKVVPEHRPYAVTNGLWDGPGLVNKEKLDRFWKPYLDGKSGFDEAIGSQLEAL